MSTPLTPLTERKLDFGTPHREEPPPPPPPPPQPVTLSKVRLEDSLPGVVQRTAHAVKEFVRWLFALLSRVPFEPQPLREPARRVVHERIPRDLFRRFAEVKASLPAEQLRSMVRSNHYFAPEHVTEIFRTMGRGRVASGDALFERAPHAIFLYLRDVRWRAAYWGSVERLANRLKDRVVTPNPRDLDPRHAEICLQKFYEDPALPRGVPQLVNDFHGVRLGMNPNTLPRQDGDPFLVLLELPDALQAEARLGSALLTLGLLGD